MYSVELFNPNLSLFVYLNTILYEYLLLGRPLLYANTVS